MEKGGEVNRYTRTVIYYILYIYTLNWSPEQHEPRVLATKVCKGAFSFELPLSFQLIPQNRTQHPFPLLY